MGGNYKRTRDKTEKVRKKNELKVERKPVRIRVKRNSERKTREFKNKKG